MHLLLELFEFIVFLLAILLYLLLRFITSVLDAFRAVCEVQLVSMVDGIPGGERGRYIPVLQESISGRLADTP